MSKDFRSSEAFQALREKAEAMVRNGEVQLSEDTRHLLQGYGMLSMKERVEICSGKFQAESSPGEGALLFASIPKGG